MSVPSHDRSRMTSQALEGTFEGMGIYHTGHEDTKKRSDSVDFQNDSDVELVVDPEPDNSIKMINSESVNLSSKIL